MILTIEYNQKGAVELVCDKEGLNLLLKKLEILKKRGGHEHLMTPSWAGNELTEERFNHENLLINQLNIILKNCESKLTLLKK